jgi:radical SAM superfamily enzyme YgiQ (UPF0313 family)
MQESFGPMSIAAVLRREGHQVDALVEGGERDLIRAATDYGPDIAGFYCTTGLHHWAVETARRLKELLPGVLTVFGGPHPTFFPDLVAKDGVDVVCVGEGERAMGELCRRLDRGESFTDIPNLQVKWSGSIHRNPVGHLVEDLETLPPVHREMYYKYPYLGRNSTKRILCGRGCPNRCTFCYNRRSLELYRGKGRFLRLRDPASVIREIREVVATWGARNIRFEDDDLTFDRAWATDLLERYAREVGLPFNCHIRADLEDDGICRLLKKAGCVYVCFGLESGNERIRQEVLRKGISDRQIRETARLLHRSGLRFATTNMVGLPGETLDDALSTVRLNQEIGTDEPWFSIFQPYPGTDLETYSAAMGVLERIDPDRFDPSYMKSSRLRQPDIRSVCNVQRLFYPLVKLPRLFPLLRRLVRLPSNPVFDGIFLLTFAWRYKRFNLISTREILSLGRHSWRFFGRGPTG